MASYEVQAKSNAGWQIVGVFDDYDNAHECATQLDQDRIHDDLRITREIEDERTGLFRASTVYRCGQRVRDEHARAEAEKEKLTAMEKRQRRLGKDVVQRRARKSNRAWVRRDSQVHPLSIAFWTALLFTAGMVAVYYFEFVLFNR